ncbi:hypothetical protein JJL45_00350 [Tamlana sp. s12]|uniref:M23 family metallopeptidase n=1 Tax=Tamlana sp. s12 TaxID=1630406 RepID=UPI0009EE51E6|nr:M23 family metallopeptidase [Tamlana sp. s12]QQY82477.1 hypothetical protein JJL45_00350 [Tamlana sp. s12]
MKVDYPILPEYANAATEADKSKTIERYFGHYNRAGFFPLGVHNTWHGGIHLEGIGTKVRAIADGRIIAYRIPEDYILEKYSTDAKYSNGFILIQHDFETPKKVKLRFYSLYMHLQPKIEMEASEAGENIPDLYAKYVVKTKLNSREMGLKVREYIPEIFEKQKKETHFFAKGTKLKMEYDICLPEEHWMCGNPSYVFCSYNNKVFCVYKGYLTEEVDGYVKIDHYKAKELNVFGSETSKGTMLFDGIEGNYIGMECKDVELDIEFTKNKNWYKIKNINHFVLAQDFTSIRKKIKDGVELNKVVNDDMPITAGQIIGGLGKYDSENRNAYNALHLEVFTDDANLSEFINNTKDKDKSTFEVAKGKVLQAAKPCNFLKANTKVKIYESDGGYTQIGFENVRGVIKRSHLVYHNNHYTVIPEFFEEINLQMKNVLPNDKSRLYYKETIGNDRVVAYKMNRSGEKYWVKSSMVTGKTGEWVTLTLNINEVYDTNPDLKNKDVLVEKTSQARKVAVTRDDQNTEWWQIKTGDLEGWIKKSELIEKTPYNWSDFGWKVLDNTGDQYFYMFGEFVEKSSPHAFVEQIWQQADTNADQVLSNFELQQVMQNRDQLESISKLICKHESEWNMRKKIAEFETELCSLFEKGINEEEDFEKKQKLEKQREDKISVLKDKIDNLCFWDEIESGELVPVTERRQDYIYNNSFTCSKYRNFGLPTKEEMELGWEFDLLEEKRIKRQFPKDSKVYHFHPIAFVEQMKMVVGKYGIRSGYNIDLAVKKLQENAKPKPLGKCGRFVRYALEAGFSLERNGLLGKTPGAAKDYDTFLRKKKFYLLDDISNLEEYAPMKGDIAVFVAFQGVIKTHQYGHIQMYDGEKWISDFKQRGFWAGGDYRAFKPSFNIYRW